MALATAEVAVVVAVAGDAVYGVRQYRRLDAEDRRGLGKPRAPVFAAVGAGQCAIATIVVLFVLEIPVVAISDAGGDW